MMGGYRGKGAQRTWLVTGGAGFIGSNLVRHLLAAHPQDLFVVVDKLTYAGDLQNLDTVRSDLRLFFVQADICDRQKMEQVFDEYAIGRVFHLAAETHVDRSIADPDVFIRSNVTGTHVLLGVARRFWAAQPDDPACRTYQPDARFIQVSTDEVYGSLGESGSFSETSPLAPSSPYAASKAAADLLALAWWKTYGLPVIVTRCCNNYGPRQNPEKLIPLVIRRCLDNRPVPVYGDGLQVRDWLHVSDHCSALDQVMQLGEIGAVYNIGANNEWSNLALVRCILRVMGKPESLIELVKDRPGHDWRYAVDATKIRQLGWQPQTGFEEDLRQTIDWYARTGKDSKDSNGEE